MSLRQDKAVIGELARAYRELAALPVHKERERRIRQANGLKAGRPIVWIDEVPWNEMNVEDELTLRCDDAFAREMESRLRRALYRWKHFRVDMVLEPSFYLEKTVRNSGFGISVQEETTATDDTNHIISHHYFDQLDTDEKLDALSAPVVQADPQEDAKRVELAETLLDGILPVKLRGHGIYYAPWDVISRYRGVEPILVDLVERPDFIHRTMERFTEFYVSQYEQMQALGLLEVNLPSLHCTPAYTDDLPAADYDGGPARFKDMWFRGMAQMFSSASPAMRDEFDLQYMRRLMDRCGLAYYGCCEPLDRFIPYLKKVPNMRKIGVTPWADVRACAEQIGPDYVLAYKPNPAMVAGSFDADAVRREIEQVIHLARANGCSYEMVLKDISTVGYRPQNLFDWADTVMRAIGEAYA